MKTRILFAAACVCGVAFGAISLDGAWSLAYRPQQEAGEWKTVPGDALIDLERVNRALYGEPPFVYADCLEWRRE